MHNKKRLDDKDLESFPGLGPKSKLKLCQIGISRISDLILFLPSFLIDKTKMTDISNVENASKCIFIGKIIKIFKTKGFRPHLMLLVNVGDETIQIRFIHKIIMYSNLKVDMKIRFSGIIYRRRNIFEIIHPEIEIIHNNKDLEKITPYYKTKKLLSQNKLRSFIKHAYNYISKNPNEDIFNAGILEKLNIPHYLKALKDCHFPSSQDYKKANIDFEAGRKRFVLEELLAYKLVLSQSKKAFEKNKSYKFIIEEDIKRGFIKNLPFELTYSQCEAINDIEKSFLTGRPTKRLLQGDVGSGKTVVAAIASYYAVKSNLQAVILVPTEILCDQHLETFRKLFSSHDIKIETLKSNLKPSTKKSIIAEIQDGTINIIIATHAILQKNIIFQKLGLIIIDEQHKFGIKQRIKLIQKKTSSDNEPHQLFLSATPIPRSLSLVLYEGLDYTIIDELPKNRKTIETKLLKNSERNDLYKNINRILKNNEQVFWVCSCIDYTESLEAEYVSGVYDFLCEKFNNIRIDILHSKAGNNENTKSINNFISGKTQILVCTTMIEVGVDVSNATCIVVEDSERFGLAQLHQLRGRVGRGDKQSYCYLVYKESISETAYARIRSLESHSNGFKIAEEDLKLRGAGEYLGNRQSGYNDNLKIASPEDIIVNFDLIKNSQKEILLLDKEKKDMLIKRWRRNTQEEIQL